VTLGGVLRNIKVSVFFIYSWLANSKGHFELDGGIEDSATAEISRSQIWQYIFHQVQLFARILPLALQNVLMVSLPDAAIGWFWRKDN